MELNELLDKVKQGESETLELKKSTGQLERGMESLCGMLNGEGGSVVFGVTDEGNVVGQEVGDSTKREIASCIREFEPFPLLNIEYIGLPNTDKQLIVITTTSTDDKPFVYKGRPYMRVESTTATMPQARYHDLLDRSNRAVIQWERRTNPELTLSDLDEEEIKRTVRIGVEMGRLPEAAYRSDIPTVLTNLELMKDGRLTNAAAVLYLKHETMEYPQLLLRLARFQGTDNRVFLDNKQVRGNVFLMLEEAMAFFFRHLNLSGEVKGLYREERLTVPRDALRECVINALIHREYNTPGGSIGIAIFNDRIEIVNFGQIPQGVDYSSQNPPMISKPNNPIIARSFFYRGTFENWGRGLGLMKSKCLEAGLPEPEITSRNGNVIVVFRFDKMLNGQPIESSGTLNGILNGTLNGTLNDSQQLVYEYIRTHPGCQASEIIDHCGIPRDTLNKILRKLIEEHNLIERRGSKRTGGYYIK